MILFLDFDGVLHPDPCRNEDMLFCRLLHFESVMRDFPEVDIVITSIWRNTRDLAKLRALFSPDIAKRIVGVTPDWREVEQLVSVVGPYSRQVEIEGWLRQAGREGEPWLALDDRPKLFAPLLPNLICCDPEQGLGHEAIRQLRHRFG